MNELQVLQLMQSVLKESNGDLENALIALETRIESIESNCPICPRCSPNQVMEDVTDRIPDDFGGTAFHCQRCAKIIRTYAND